MPAPTPCPSSATLRRLLDGDSPADQAELLAWHWQTGAGRTFLTHGEENIMQQFAAKLAGTHA